MSDLYQRLLEAPVLQPLLTELRANERLRWMVFGVLSVFLLYLVLVLDDVRAEAVAEYRPLALREARLEELASNTDVDFAAYYERQQAADAALREQFWRSTSRGLAGAELQSWLRRLAREHSLQKSRLDLSEARPVPGLDSEVWRFEAELSGELLPSDARALASALASSDRKLRVERLNYSPQRGDRFTVRLLAYFIIEESES
jgi:hypothetical protein